jgi:hypothetical protein
LDGYVADARVAEAKRLIDGLRRDRRQHPYRGRGEYSGRAREVAGAIADMIESGGAAHAVPLARRAVERVTAAMLHMDDSSGIIGGDLRMLTALYARACRAAPPDAKQLAAWLVTSRLDGPGWPDIELADFADALGQTGLDEVARLVTERRIVADPDPWAAIGIKFLRQQLAALSGDVDAHVAVLAENLHGARQYGEIVTVLRDAGRGADAERWARRGLAEDPAGYWADGLREQLAGLLLASGRGEEAVCVHRAEFERRTLHQDYSRLRDTAERAGQWSGLREWALEYLRARAQVKEFYVRELIGVLIGEELPDEAWTTAVAAPGQVPEEQWLELIGLQEPGHPADVIGPLRDLIEMGIERTSDKYRYPKAIKALNRLRDDYQRAGDEEGFTTYLDELRQRQRRKTSFIAKLDAAFAPTAG